MRDRPAYDPGMTVTYAWRGGFEEPLRAFYDACGFRGTVAGLLAL